MSGDPFDDPEDDGFDAELVDVDERLADYVDDRLDERDRERFEAELRVSPRLRDELAQYQRTVAAVQQALRAPTQPTQLADRVMAALAAEATRPSLVRRKLRPFLFAAASAAALLTLAVVVDRLGAPEVSQRTDFASTPTVAADGAGEGAAEGAVGAAPGAPEPEAESAVGAPRLGELLAQDDAQESGIGDEAAKKSELLRLEQPVRSVVIGGDEPVAGARSSEPAQPLPVDADKSAKPDDGQGSRRRGGAPPVEEGVQEQNEGRLSDDRTPGSEVLDRHELEASPTVPGGVAGRAGNGATSPASGGPAGPTTGGPAGPAGGRPQRGGTRGAVAPGAPSPTGPAGGGGGGGAKPGATRDDGSGDPGDRRVDDNREVKRDDAGVAVRKSAGGAKSKDAPGAVGDDGRKDQVAPVPTPEVAVGSPIGKSGELRFAASGERATRLPVVTIELDGTTPELREQLLRQETREQAPSDPAHRPAQESDDGKHAAPKELYAADLLAGFVAGEFVAVAPAAGAVQVDSFFVAVPAPRRLGGLQLRPLAAAPGAVADAARREWLVVGSRAELERLMREVARLAAANGGHLSTGEAGVVGVEGAAPTRSADPGKGGAVGETADGGAGQPLRHLVLRFRRR